MTDGITGVIFGIATIAVLVTVYWLWIRQKPLYERFWRDLDGIGIPKHLCTFNYEYTTNGGVKIVSTVAVPSSAFSLIDEGIRNQLVRHTAAFPDWNKFAQLSDYTLVFIEPMATNQINEPGSPALIVGGTQTAGTCIGVWVFAASKPTIVLPHQAATDWRYNDYLMRSAWHESEHIREFANDYEEFLRHTGPNDIHPHIGSFEASRYTQDHCLPRSIVKE